MTTPKADLETFVATFHESSTVRRLLARALRQAFRRDPDGTMGARVRVAHVCDWIAGAVSTSLPWTRDLDDEGFPRRLTRFGSLDHAWRTADKMIRREAAVVRQRLLETGAEVSGGETEMLLDGGWRVVRLATPKHLDFETAFMDHCIGGGAYDDKVETGRSLFFSLRDPDNRPHVTMETVDEGVLRVVQCWGPGNTFPSSGTLPMLLAFFEAKKADYAFLAPMFGRIADLEGALHDLSAIGPWFAAKGPVWFPPGTDALLPHGFRVSGDVHVATGAGVRFGTGTTVYGNLHLHPDSLADLPDGLIVSEDLHGPGSGVRSIGSGTRIMGSANLAKCPVETVGNDLVVGKDLLLSGCALPVLPKCWISGVLTIGKGVGALADGVFCRTLDADDADFRRIGDGVSVAGRASLPRTLETIGSDFRTGKSLDLNCPALASVGDGLTVGGSLYGYETALAALPARCSVGLGIEMPKSALTSIPSDLEVGHAIRGEDLESERRPTFDMSGSKLSALPDGFSFGGDVTLDGCPIEELPPGMDVGCDLSAKETRLRTLPADLRVGMDLVLDGSPVERLPAGLSVMWLGMKRTPIAELPTGLSLRDGGSFSGTALTELPADMEAGGNLVLPVEMDLPPGVTASTKFENATPEKRFG